MAAAVTVTSLFYILGLHVHVMYIYTCTLRLDVPILVGILTKVHITVLYTVHNKSIVEWCNRQVYTSA